MKLQAMVLGLLLSATPVLAQSPATGGIKSNVDWAVNTAPGVVSIAGWVFDCDQQGQQPYSVKMFALRAHETTGVWIEPLIRRSGLLRPDVAAAFTNCGGPLNPYVGYQLIFENVPTGTMTIALQWSNYTSVKYTQRVVEVR